MFKVNLVNVRQTKLKAVLQMDNYHIEYKTYIIEKGIELGIPVREVLIYIFHNYTRRLQYLNGKEFMEDVTKDLKELAK